MIVIAGPTASGKTDLAAALALRLGGEVISADSRQVYRCLDAATAKPPAALRAKVPHHLIDVVNPTEAYDAGRFAKDAAAAIAGIRSRGKVPIVCGGTGLYLRALMEGLSPLPQRNEGIRARLEAQASKDGAEALHSRLKKIDAKAAEGISAANVPRVIRALEVFELTGKPLSSHWAEGRSGGITPSAVLRLEVPNDVLRARIESRAEDMWPRLLAEVRSLVPSRCRGDEPGFTSLGYREAVAVLNGDMTEDEGFDGMVRATHAYAKRQRTWFRGQLSGAVAVAAGLGPERTLAHALSALSAPAVVKDSPLVNNGTGNR
ncbi:MAG: tRNA (adenosine(37)-N6)-dimethylallyltransferase MiaA [Elusimicrobia bacterium]|nr:tRNA (adenosine(37)-N6)-dimethylallyltransferase MiaA [Elusimicrobiota bacterium]